MLAPTSLATFGLVCVCSLPNLAAVDETGACVDAVAFAWECTVYARYSNTRNTKPTTRVVSKRNVTSSRCKGVGAP